MIHIFFPLSAARRSKAILALHQHKSIILGGCIVTPVEKGFEVVCSATEAMLFHPLNEAGKAIDSAASMALRLAA